MELYDAFTQVVKEHDLLSCHVLLAAVSGGPDSMCLLDLLFRFSQEDFASNRPFDTLAVAHFDHQIRKDSSALESRLVRQYCESRGILFFTDSQDVPAIAAQSGMGIEHAARDARHRFFERLAMDFEASGKSVRIALAHHRQDRAETMMMNIFRGSGLDGLCAMSIRRGRLVRPLIFTGKEEIMRYLSDHCITFSVDETNMDLKFTRNRWRNVVFPAIEEISNKPPDLALAQLAEHLEVDQNYLDGAAESIFREISKTAIDHILGISCSKWIGLHPAMVSRVLRILYEKTFGDLVDFGSNRVSEIVNMARSGQSNLRLSVSGQREAHIDDDTLYFLNHDERTTVAPRTMNVNGKNLLVANQAESLVLVLDCLDDLNASLSKYGQCVIRNPQMLISVHIRRVENMDCVVYNNLTWFGTLESLSGLALRHPRSGDRFSRAGGAGSKLLRRFLTDMKVPSHIRDSLLILCSDSEVIWIPGLAHARGFVDAVSCERFMTQFRDREDKSLLKLEIYELRIIPDEV